LANWNDYSDERLVDFVARFYFSFANIIHYWQNESV
jgi:hypothetical protein